MIRTVPVHCVYGPHKQTSIRMPDARLLYKENHWLGQWFRKAYGDE